MRVEGKMGLVTGAASGLGYTLVSPFWPMAFTSMPSISDQSWCVPMATTK